MLLVLQEIVDETDRYIDNLRLQRVNAALLTSNLPRHLRKCAPLPTSPPEPDYAVLTSRQGARLLRLELQPT